MPKEVLIQDLYIVNKIYIIHGEKVMLDKDLAEMYGVTTGNLNKAVKRNLKRFPADFMFQVAPEDFNNLKFQNGISSWGGTRKMPFAFTELGVSMLSSVLNSDRAIEIKIRIMRTFMQLRETLIGNTEMLLKLEKLDKKIINLGHDVTMHDGEIETIFELINDIKKEQTNPKKVTVVQGLIKKKI
jgi:ORF6N domain